jgi:hypothetical protein
LVGIELTEAVPPDWAWASAHRERENYDKAVSLQRFRPGEPRRSVAEIDSIARGAHFGDIWEGDAPEGEWAEVMTHFSLQKSERFSTPGFKRFESNWLLIYKNWPLPAVDEPEAAAHFSRRLCSLEEPLPFDRVFVECFRSIWQFRGTEHSAQALRDLWGNDS